MRRKSEDIKHYIIKVTKVEINLLKDYENFALRK